MTFAYFIQLFGWTSAMLLSSLPASPPPYLPVSLPPTSLLLRLPASLLFVTHLWHCSALFGVLAALDNMLLHNALERHHGNISFPLPPSFHLPSSLSFSTCFCLPLFFPPFVTHSVWYRPSWFRTRQYAPALQRNRGNLISAWLPLWPPVKGLPDAREKAANEWTNVKKRTHLICKMSSLSHLLKAPHVKNYRTTNDESFSYCDLIGCIQPQCTQVNPVLR